MTKKKVAKKATKRTAKKAVKKAVKKKAASHGRAPGKTQISISLPENLVEKIDKLAAQENRNRSNFIANHLESLTEKT